MALNMWRQRQQQHTLDNVPVSRRAAGQQGLAGSNRTRRLNLQVTCMAHPRRVAKVASQIQREVSEMFIYDKVVQQAICPERRSGMDDQLSAVASITDVYVSGDLQVVKVYVSVYSDEQGKERAITNLKRIAPYVRSRIGQSVRLRLTPEIRFVQDNSLDDLEQIQEAIGKEDFDRYVAEAEAEAAGLAAPGSSSSSGSGSSSAADAAAAAAAGFAAGQGEGEGDDDDDSGFFDIGGDEDEDEEDGEGGWEDADSLPAGAAGEAAAAGDGRAGRKVAWSRRDPDTFFAVDEDELQEAEQGAQWYAQPGPFDDLFVGAGEQLAEERDGGSAPKQARQRSSQQRQGQRQQRRGSSGSSKRK